MIQEKDFLYRVPVKTAPITTPGGQIRNPEILVDIEGGEFMHGNILDANSTNKLVNQSVKDAVDKNIADGSFVTKDLLDKEVDRATSAESDLQAAIDTKADAIALSNYVLTTALNQQVDTLNTAINAKQDAGNYIPYYEQLSQDTYFGLEKGLRIYSEAANKIMNISHYNIKLETNSNDIVINENGFSVSRDSDGTCLCTFTPSGIKFEGKTASDIPTANGSFIDISDYATRDFVTAGLAAKQNKITVNDVDVTDIETADITKLRTIVNDLITALISSGLINATSSLE